MADEKPRAERVVRDGRVAVLVSPGYGAGWSTWGDSNLREQMLFCPRMVLAIEAGAQNAELHKIAAELFPGEYPGGVDQLKIRWVREGDPIRIAERHGFERIRNGSDGLGTDGLVTP